jgi:two-component system, sensor histidine kinase and response regulator
MKILVIEDDLPIRQTLGDLLEINGHTVFQAASGGEALLMATDRPDFIFCDIGLPDIDGYEVIRRLRSEPGTRDTPFVYLTARADRENQRRGMALGADDYITKPFTEREILDAVEARTRRLRPLKHRIEALLEDHHREVSAHWAHELLTPLSAVIGGLEMLELEAGTLEPAQFRELVSIIRDGAERQLRLARKLIRHFEMERYAEKGGIEPAGRCDAPSAIRAAAKRAEFDPHWIGRVTVECDPGFVALGDALFADVVYELIENALRFSPPRSPVTVCGRTTPVGFSVEVTDTGPGLSAEAAAQVAAFRQFNRRSTEQQGLGLGLSIVKTAAALCNGALNLENLPDGKGLRATFITPLAPNDDPKPAALQS